MCVCVVTPIKLALIQRLVEGCFVHIRTTWIVYRSSPFFKSKEVPLLLL